MSAGRPAATPAAALRRAHAAWRRDGLAEEARLDAALADPAAAQDAVLRRLLASNADTEFGRRHRFARLRSVADFRAAVPPRSYDQMAPWLQRVHLGRPNVLTAGPVLRLLPTGGSGGGTKWIPWTASLAAEFRRGVRAWIAALYRHHPGIAAGAHYWSLSPPVTSAVPPGPLEAGFGDDEAYLPPAGRRAFAAVRAVPAWVTRAAGHEEFLRDTLACLLARADLAFVSVWSPTFLATLLRPLFEDPDPVLARLAALPGGPARARRLAAAFAGGRPAAALAAAWPRLALISCWADGPSAAPARELRALFPRVPMQGKGLLATEAFVSLPLRPGADPVPALRSHFLEFEDAAGAARGAAELDRDGEYAVLVTTGGGLYRYRLGDRVRVTGLAGSAPMLRFAGREGRACDLCGEKLTEAFAAGALARAERRAGVRPRFALLAPAPRRFGPGYALFVESDAPPAALRSLAAALDAGLSASFAYAHARGLGQLRPVRAFRVERRRGDPNAAWLREGLARGQRRGDIKPATLDEAPGWERRLAGAWL